MSYNNRMKTLSLLFFAMILFGGCFNERGISLRYYNECEEYYDVQGYYHKKCDPNLVDYVDIKEALKPVPNPKNGSVE